MGMVRSIDRMVIQSELVIGTHMQLIHKLSKYSMLQHSLRMVTRLPTALMLDWRADSFPHRQLQHQHPTHRLISTVSVATTLTHSALEKDSLNTDSVIHSANMRACTGSFSAISTVN